MDYSENRNYNIQFKKTFNIVIINQNRVVYGGSDGLNSIIYLLENIIQKLMY